MSRPESVRLWIPLNCWGVTPTTIVMDVLFMLTALPKTAGFPPNRVCQ